MAFPLDVNTLEVQQFTESTWGTNGTATVRRRGVTDFNIIPINKTDRIEERRGTLVPAYFGRVIKRGANANETGIVFYEDITYLLNSLFDFSTATGAGPYVRPYNAPVNAASTHKTYSIYYGDPADYAGYIQGAFLNKLVLSGNANGYLGYKADWLGKQGATGTASMMSTAAAAELPNGVPVIGADLTLYMDAWGGTIGTTAIAASAFKWELSFDAKREVRWYGGNLLPQAIKHGRMDGTLKLSLEVNSASTTLLTNLMNMTSVVQQQIRLKFTDGTNILQLDFAGTAEEAPQFYDQDSGDVFFNATFKATYNTGLGNWFKASLTNGVSAAVLV